MGKFKELQIELDSVEQGCLEQKQAIRERAVSIMSVRLSRNSKLNKYVKQLESSMDLCSTEDEYFSQWIRFDASDFIDTHSEIERYALTEYMSTNHFATVDFKNDALMQSIGPCIIINEDGDVLDQDSGRWIIGKNDYESESERNKLIEKYMDKAGYFPSVVSCDRYNNAFYVNTKCGEK